MTNVDAPLDAHLHDLATVCGAGLDARVRPLRGLSGRCGRTPATRLSFLRAASRDAARAFYVNRQGRTVQQILREEELRRAINDYLDSRRLLRSVA